MIASFTIFYDLRGRFNGALVEDDPCQWGSTIGVGGGVGEVSGSGTTPLFLIWPRLSIECSGNQYRRFKITFDWEKDGLFTIHLSLREASYDNWEYKALQSTLQAVWDLVGVT